jgi:hypothetical protein
MLSSRRVDPPLFEGSKQSRYFSFVLWPVIAAIYWRQIDLTELSPPFVAHLAVTVGFDVCAATSARAKSAGRPKGRAAGAAGSPAAVDLAGALPGAWAVSCAPPKGLRS